MRFGKAASSGTCLWCGRPAKECWTMPCLTLQQVLDTKDDNAMKAWAKQAGATLSRKSEE